MVLGRRARSASLPSPQATSVYLKKASGVTTMLLQKTLRTVSVELLQGFLDMDSRTHRNSLGSY